MKRVIAFAIVNKNATTAVYSSSFCFVFDVIEHE